MRSPVTGSFRTYQDHGVNEMRVPELLTLLELPPEAFIQVATDPRDVAGRRPSG